MSETVTIYPCRPLSLQSAWKYVQRGAIHSSRRYLLDFRKCERFASHEVLVIAQLIFILREHGCEVNGIFEEGQIGPTISDGMGMEALQTLFEMPANSSDLPLPSGKVIPIQRLRADRLGAYIANATPFFEKFARGKDLTIYKQYLLELVNNVEDHANSPAGALVCTEFMPEKGLIILAVGDNGKGIAASVNSYLAGLGQPPLSPSAAILWAVQKRNTSKSHPYNQGRGLDIVYTANKASDGSFNILTDRTLFVSNKQHDSFFTSTHLPDIPGTIIKIAIPVAKLDDVEPGNEESMW